ncbi:hypothetical protein KIL84_006954 [Mauremys mutica]|uniref:Uncharacterized protein n=1 Tax=Mauremys mutica TaxID=74926 RepID=A0A9D3X0X5_9SAUR|nr:hypothetical protein KIL84_006954 [Mauremys mutica]
MKHDTFFVRDPRILLLTQRFHMYVINFYWFNEDEASPSNLRTIQSLTVSLIKDCMAQANGEVCVSPFLGAFTDACIVYSKTILAVIYILDVLDSKCKLPGKKEVAVAVENHSLGIFLILFYCRDLSILNRTQGRQWQSSN